MFRNFFVILVLGSCCSFLYGIWNIFMEVEHNSCRMTYMFGQPQFSRVKLKEYKEFSNYGLYYYYEGNLKKDVNTLNLNGAPVIFIPGNGGSYKQARSLASVALRKGLEDDQLIHLDYFTIDYNEELSALYGGYLENQRKFLKICIKTVLRLYKDSQSSTRKVVLIGHSMGGKLAQAILTDVDVVKYINSNIFISSPLDKPVVNFDLEINEFYDQTTAYLYRNRAMHEVNSESNFCGTLQTAIPSAETSISHNHSASADALANILLISIGGGNRDLLVRAGLTTSQFSDIHAMTSSIPNVWLSCDHLSSVWCLQLVLVINRFLFSISTKDANNYVLFKEEKASRLQAASGFFVRSRSHPKKIEVQFPENSENWHEHSKRVFRRQFHNGLKKTYNQMIPLDKYEKFKKLYVEVINKEDHDWIFGCAANMLPNETSVCKKGTSLSHYIQNVPSKDILRSTAVLDLYNIKKTYANWTHVLVRLPPTKKSIFFNVDIHDPIERTVRIKGPRWFTFRPRFLFNETAQGTLHYKIHIQGLTEPYQAIQINIKPLYCWGKKYHVTAKICAPWARGFDRYQVLTESTGNDGVYVNVPTSSPRGYNTSINPVLVELFLDPSCRFSVSYQLSVANTMSKTVQEFYHWLPAHLIAVLLVVLKTQISKFHSDVAPKKSRPYVGFFQFTSFYLITGCRIFRKMLNPVHVVSTADLSNESLYGSAIVHSTTIALSIIAAFGVWGALKLQGNFMYSIALRLSNLSLVTSSALVSVVTVLPITFGVLAISLAFGSCSGVALVFACAVYFVMMSNAYKDQIEDFFLETASNLTKPPDSSPKANVAAEVDKLIDNTANDELDDQPQVQIRDNSKQMSIDKTTEKRLNSCIGFQNFAFHITMFLLLCILAALNSAVTLAWLKNYKTGHQLPDPALTPTVVVLGSLSLLWQLKAPKKLVCHHFILVVLYVSASACVIFCQEAVFRINYVVAFVFVAILVHESLSRLWKFVSIKFEKNQN